MEVKYTYTILIMVFKGMTRTRYMSTGHISLHSATLQIPPSGLPGYSQARTRNWACAMRKCSHQLSRFCSTQACTCLLRGTWAASHSSTGCGQNWATSQMCCSASWVKQGSWLLPPPLPAAAAAAAAESPSTSSVSRRKNGWQPCRRHGEKQTSLT